MVASTGVAAASPKAQSVLPAILSATLSSNSMSRINPSPRSILRSMFSSHTPPSRHGVHLPHDS
jgi:hypothetical protein